MGHVPEEKREGQVAELLRKLAGHRIFGRRRGTLGVSVINCLLAIIQTAGSPTAAVRQWDEFAADIRVLIQMLATLKRDGQDYAGEELAEVLRTKKVMFTGETTPVEQTTPVVLYMYGATQTLTMLQWMVTHYETAIYAMLDSIDGKAVDRSHGGGLTSTTERLFELFPSLTKYARKLRKQGAYPGPDLSSAFEEDVEKRYPKPFPGSIPLWLGRGWHRDQYCSGLEIDHQPFAYIIEGEQSEVLSNFARNLQGDVATWQFHIPTVVWEGLKTIVDTKDSDDEIVVEMFPRDFSRLYQGPTPQLISRSVSHDWVARVVIGEEREYVGGENHDRRSFSVALCGNRRL